MKHVIVLHVNHLNAALIDELVAMLKERRYGFIPLEGGCRIPPILGLSRRRARDGRGSNGGSSL